MNILWKKMCQHISTVFVIIFTILLENNSKILASKCDKRYLTHYETKGCKPVYEDDTDCPSRYDCSAKIAKDKTVCHFKGKTYQEGDSIDVGDPCQTCSCRKSGIDGGLNVHCYFVECFRPPLNSSCYHIYELDECCPVKTQCSESVEQKTTDDKKICEHDGKTYKYGQKIETDGNECLSCLCNEKWSGVNNASCRHFDCYSTMNQENLEKGCIPIYYEASCCPMEFHCGENGEKEETHSFATYANQDEISEGKACQFKEKHYSIGDTLDIHHRSHCVTCTCVTPPDFRCVQKSCPSPPGGRQCKYNFKPKECCPTFDCKP